MSARVAITGVGLVTPVGHDLDAVLDAARTGRHGVVRRPPWEGLLGIRSALVAAVSDLDLDRWPRKQVRTMGRVARLATEATERAVRAAGLDSDMLASGAVGLAYGSTHGASDAWERFARGFIEEGHFFGGGGGAYLQFMSHTCAANLALFFGVRGRVVPACAACASGSLAIGLAAEAIRAGAQDVMLAGGAEELHYITAGVFDAMGATSSGYNDRPQDSPRPFDSARDGLVLGEGAGTLVLEGWDHARARGAPILAELVGFGTNCDGVHVTAPSARGMQDAMCRALADARVSAGDVDYVSAHATATVVGDACESEATFAVFGDRAPVSSFKGHIGHTLGACGAIEAALCVGLLGAGFVPPTRNLARVGDDCAPLDYVVGAPRDARVDVALTNNFAFGGINTSLVLRRA